MIVYTALLLLAALNTPAYAQALFGPKADYATGNESTSVFTADLDGDGDNDLAVANWGGTVSVFLNNGDGTFADKVDYEAGDAPRSVFVADLDGDGDNDLTVANGHFRSTTVSVLMNNGDGTFAAKVTYGTGSNPKSIFSADLDEDGDNDLAVATKSNTVSVLLNNGDGTFAAKVDYPAGDSPVSVFSSDLDGDGDNDLAVANVDGVSVLLDLSIRGVTPPPIVTSISPISGVEVGGTRVRITGSNFQSGATVTFGDMAPTNLVEEATNIITAVTPAHPVGSVDVIVTNPDGLADTLFNGFEFVEALFGLKTDYDTGFGLKLVSIADLDGDGDNDLAVAGGGTVSVLKNNGDGTFATRVSYGTGPEPQSVFIADLDGDGDNDFAVANSVIHIDFFLGKYINSTVPKVLYQTGTVSVLKNNGDGTFATRVSYGTGPEPQSVFIADLDGDGDNDLAVANFGGFESPSGTVSVLFNNADGTFAPKVDYAVGNEPVSVFSSDLDGDGDNDLAVANSALFGEISSISVLLNNGDGTFAPKVGYLSGNSPWSVFSADLDGDKDNDLAVANFGGSVSVLLNNGDGTFAHKVDYNAEGTSVFSADLDGDGDNDLAVAGGGKVSVLLNRTIITAVTEYEEPSRGVP